MLNTTFMTTHMKLVLLTALLIVSGCHKDDYKFGDITTPAKPTLNISVAGKDDADGDGSGAITLCVQSDNGIHYKVDFGNALPPHMTARPDRSLSRSPIKATWACTKACTNTRCWKEPTLI